MSVTAGAVAVVGASGFLGSALAGAFKSQGTSTTEFTREAPVLRASGPPPSGFTRADTIYWMASSINPLVAENDRSRVEHDLDTVRAALADLRRMESPARFVLLSSGGTVYDPQSPPPYSEQSPVAPKGAYGRAKRALEELVQEARPGSTIVRVANAYGAGQPLAPGQGVLGHWLRALRAGRPIQVFGPASTARDYIHVRDISSALLALHCRAEVPAVVNLGSGRATTLSELLDILRAEVGDVAVEQLAARSFDIERTWLDITVARKELGWEPQVGLAEGVADMWRWLVADPTR